MSASQAVTLVEAQIDRLDQRLEVLDDSILASSGRADEVGAVSQSLVTVRKKLEAEHPTAALLIQDEISKLAQRQEILGDAKEATGARHDEVTNLRVGLVNLRQKLETEPEAETA